MPHIFTIGYEGTDIDRFVSTLKTNGVDLLVDVRAVALSRKRGFSKKALQSRLAEDGIGYLHLIQLGDPKPGREAAKAGRHELFESIYRSHLAMDGPQEALRTLKQIVGSQSLCLMCFERDPSTCHRSIVADALNLPAGEVVHLHGDLPRRYDHFPKSRRHPGESLTAAE